METIKKLDETVISASAGDLSKLENMVKDTKLAKGIGAVDKFTNKKSLVPGKFIDSGLDKASKKMGLNRDSFTIGKDKAKTYHSFKKGATQGLTKKQSTAFNEKIKGIDGKFEKGIDGKFKKAEFKFMRKKKSFKYTDITFSIVFVYVIICLFIDVDKYDKWWKYFVLKSDYSLYIFLGTFISLLTNDELGSPIKLMRNIMVEILGKNNEYGFSYFLERIWLPLFSGLRKGTSVSANVFSWPLSKMILYFPILIITLFQYIIPIVITIILIPITLVVGLISGVISEGAGTALTVEGSEVTDEAEAEVDMFIAGVLKKIWRTINKIIPFKKLLAVYIIGLTFYKILLPLLIDVYLTFAVFILTHIVLNKILIKGLLNNFPEKLQSYILIKILGYALIMGAYYYIQFQVNLKFYMTKDNKGGGDPISTILEMFGLDDHIPKFLNTYNVKGSVKSLLFPKDPESEYSDSTTPHLRVAINIFIFFVVIKFLNWLAMYVGKFDT